MFIMYLDCWEMSNIQYANERLIQNHWAIIDIEVKNKVVSTFKEAQEYLDLLALNKKWVVCE